ncbi:disulfide bond formation protein B [Profundibacter sp.]
MTRKHLILIAAGGSLAMLLGAFGFEYLGNMPPCKLCIWQRWPHAVAVVAGLLAFAMHTKLWPLIGMLGALTTSAIGFYHTGVERHWWEGPASCTSAGASQMSTADWMDMSTAAALVRCDEIPWEMFTLSMATWNGIASLVLALIWLRALKA